MEIKATLNKPYTDNNFILVFNRHYPSKTSAYKSDTGTANKNTVSASSQYGSVDGTGAYIHIANENGCDGIKWSAFGY